MAENDMQQDVNETPSNADINTDENVAGTTHLNETVAEASELEKLRSELEEEKKKYLYLFAEFDNFKRRSSKERLELIQTAGKEVIQSLLEVLDEVEKGYLLNDKIIRFAKVVVGK